MKKMYFLYAISFFILIVLFFILVFNVDFKQEKSSLDIYLESLTPEEKKALDEYIKKYGVPKNPFNLPKNEKNQN